MTSYRMKFLPAGVEPVSRFSSKVTVSMSPSTTALTKLGGVPTAWSVKLASSGLPVAEARSGLLVGLV